MLNKIIGILLVLLSSYLFSFDLHRQYKKETEQITTVLYILSDINNILEKYPFNVKDILEYMTDKKYYPFNILFQHCIDYIENENLSFGSALERVKNYSITPDALRLIKETATAFELPNTEAITGKLQIIYSDAEHCKTVLQQEGKEKLELYTKLSKLASVLTVIIFI